MLLFVNGAYGRRKCIYLTKGEAFLIKSEVRLLFKENIVIASFCNRVLSTISTKSFEDLLVWMKHHEFIIIFQHVYDQRD
jgi:hypothetical protein